MRKKTELPKKTPAELGVPHVDSFLFRYAVECAYDETRSCEASGCDSICRCSKLENLRVTEVSGVSIDCIRLVKKKQLKSERISTVSYKPTPIEAYCLQRLLLNFDGFSTQGYEVASSGGYYGEEISGIYLNKELELRDAINTMLATKSDAEKVLYILSIEYGYVAPIIAEATSASIESLDFSSINASQGALMIKRQHEYSYELDDSSVMGVVFNGVLIDGNHRRAYRLTKPDHFKKNTAKYIVLS